MVETAHAFKEDGWTLSNSAPHQTYSLTVDENHQKESFAEFEKKIRRLKFQSAQDSVNVPSHSWLSERDAISKVYAEISTLLEERSTLLEESTHVAQLEGELQSAQQQLADLAKESIAKSQAHWKLNRNIMLTFNKLRKSHRAEVFARTSLSTENSSLRETNETILEEAQQLRSSQVFMASTLITVVAERNALRVQVQKQKKTQHEHDEDAFHLLLLLLLLLLVLVDTQRGDEAATINVVENEIVDMDTSMQSDESMVATKPVDIEDYYRCAELIERLNRNGTSSH
jgi:hypothetical protein